MFIIIAARDFVWGESSLKLAVIRVVAEGVLAFMSGLGCCVAVSTLLRITLQITIIPANFKPRHLHLDLHDLFKPSQNPSHSTADNDKSHSSIYI